MCVAHSGEVPSDAAKNAYRQQVERAYPFHPLLIDALDARWGSHPDFQCTREVLRLLARMVADLCKRRQGNTQTQHLGKPVHEESYERDVHETFIPSSRCSPENPLISRAESPVRLKDFYKTLRTLRLRERTP